MVLGIRKQAKLVISARSGNKQGSHSILYIHETPLRLNIFDNKLKLFNLFIDIIKVDVYIIDIPIEERSVNHRLQSSRQMPHL